MKRIVSILLFATFALHAPAFAATTQLPKYEPYRESEFRPWMKKLRRAEVITLGATALAYPVVGWISNYDDNTSRGFWLKFAWAAGAGALIALADFIIGEVTDDGEKKSDGYRELSPDSPEVIKLNEAMAAATANTATANAN